MSGRIPQYFIDELVARADLVDLIGSRVPLRKAGKEYKGCCPFHDEKSPSFTVVPDKQFYHCFGCGAHGTAIGFLMEFDHLGFVEAVEELAARLGLEIPREDDPGARPRPADALYRVLERVAEFYAAELHHSPQALEYVRRRGLADDTLATFGIGYAPAGWDTVLARFGRDEESRRQLHAVGLLIERDQPSRRDGAGNYYDRFRDRIVFPIRDSRGRTIGFGGRVLDQGEPKYLNSPETELFHKGRELYGLYEARKSTRAITRLLVVEGYMDVVRLHQEGVTYAVATLGTATTPEHLIRLFRVANEVVFCFDGDRAGRAAAWRALDNSLPMVRDGRQIRFLFLPEGQDPDSLVGTEGQAAFEQRLKEALPLSQYLTQELKQRFDTKTLDGRAQLADAARPLLKKIPAGVYRELLVDEVAQIVGMAAGRLEAVLDVEADTDRRRSPASPALQPSPDPARRSAASGGRRNLIRQAIHVLVHFPAAATAVSDPESLAMVDRPGIPLLIELLQSFREEPAASTGHLLERWRNRPDYASLAKLAARECLVPDLAAARLELREAVTRLVQDEAPVTRLDALLEKGRTSTLTAEEKLEIQALLKNRASRDADRGGERT